VQRLYVYPDGESPAIGRPRARRRWPWPNRWPLDLVEVSLSLEYYSPDERVC